LLQALPKNVVMNENTVVVGWFKIPTDTNANWTTILDAQSPDWVIIETPQPPSWTVINNFQ